MTTATDAKSGKEHGDENFPVARFVNPRHRGPILAFYRYVRAGDDIADHPSLPPDEKLRLLDGLEAALLGEAPPDPEAEPLRIALAEGGLSVRHAQDLYDAFRLDVTKLRYRDWGELMHYCSLSAMPVGRFVLDVHGEDGRTWTASDPLCAALQVINHLQDCAKDFRAIGRVYLPDDVLAAHGAGVEDLAAERATPGLLAALRDLNARTADLLRQSAAFPSIVQDGRLALEVSAIQALAESLVRRLESRDPLSERVHASKPEMALTAARAVAGTWLRRRFRPRLRKAAA